MDSLAREAEMLSGAGLTVVLVDAPHHGARHSQLVATMPNALEMRSNEWISPIMLSVRDLDQPHIQKGIELGRQVLRTLGMGDGMTHMEWFLISSGEVVFGEVACRPGGACVVDQMNYTGDIDLFREWARVATVGRFDASTERKQGESEHGWQAPR